MESQIKIITQKINNLKVLLNYLLLYKKPTDKAVVACSQELDEFIVQYQKFQISSKKIA